MRAHHLLLEEQLTLLLRPLPPMRRVHLDGSLQFCIYPGIANAPTGENQRVHLPAGVNHREPHVPVVGNIANGVDQMPHSGWQACEPEVRFDLAQEPSDNDRHGPLHSAREYQALSGAS
jgi:hypothetical protein